MPLELSRRLALTLALGSVLLPAVHALDNTCATAQNVTILKGGVGTMPNLEVSDLDPVDHFRGTLISGWEVSFWPSFDHGSGLCATRGAVHARPGLR